MDKVITYTRYFLEYANYGDYRSIISSISYLINRKSNRKDRIVKSRIGTFFCRGNTNDFLFANFAYEWTVKKFIFNNLNNFDVFFDAGACIGDYSILIAKSGLKCFAFEPIPDSFRVLAKNIEFNNGGALINAFPYGLGDRNHPASFVFNPVNTGDSHIDRHGGSGNCQVQLKTMDSVYRFFNLDSGNRVLFKLDVEGMEKEALEGAKEFIRYFDDLTFIIESTHTPQSAIKETLDQIASFEYGTVDDNNLFARKKQARLARYQ